MRLGTTELLLILALAILLFGGSRLAGLGKAMGKSITEFKAELHADSSGKGKDPEGKGNDMSE
ncbi:MAG: twin-arginine translocase TatA/TatE family subunit [Clostridium sp.]|nr:twin-arginine translocase TatA/TatE family subunit [Clostridium sp.]